MTPRKDPKDLLKVGRKSKYKEEYCQGVIDHMAEGYSYESYAGTIGVNRDTLYNWEKLFPEFSDSKKQGRDRLLLKFEQLGMAAILGQIKNFSASTYIFSMKNKCGWTDKTESTIDSNTEINLSYRIED